MPALPPRRSIAAQVGARAGLWVGAVVLPLAMLLAGIPARAQEPAHPVHRSHPVLHAVRRHAHALLHPHGRAAHPAHHAAPPLPPPPAAEPAPPPVPAAPLKGSNTGLPLPRFASLRADAVNLRSGPGTRYPIQWVYKRRDLPVEIEREFDVWRLVQDSDGVKGWVHQATLVGTRSFVVLAAAPADGSPSGASPPSASPSGASPPGDASAPPAGSRALRSDPRPDAAVLAILKPGVVGRIRSCAAGSDWCRVSVRSYSGWLPRSAFWGMLPDEAILPP